MTHPHKELILQWLDDPTMEFVHLVGDDRPHRANITDVISDTNGIWKFHVKKPPKPDVTFGVIVEQKNAFPHIRWPEHWEQANVDFVFDGESGKLKSARMVI